MTRRVVFISDTQIPLEDKRATRAVVQFIGSYKPDEVIHIGDLMDYATPSRWSKGTREEFAGSVVEDSEAAKKRFLEPLRKVYSGPVGVIEGNHDLRPRHYLEANAPALAEYDHSFSFTNLLDFDGYQIRHLPDMYEFAPGWVATHGHLGGISLSRIAGNTARNAAIKFNTSVVMGHTHRLGKAPHVGGFNGRVKKHVTGVEIGNLMDMTKAQYLKQGTADWQQGFAVAYVDGNHVDVQPISINARKFTVDGVTYQV